MKPDDRRRQLARATEPLLRRHGLAVTTKQIAAAADVSEGTIFKVFGSKSELIEFTVRWATDIAPYAEALREVGRETELADMVRRLVEITSERVRSVVELVIAAHWMPPEWTGSAAADPTGAAIRDLFGEFADELAVPPESAAHITYLLTFAGTHPLINEGQTLGSDEIIATLLHGIARNPGCAEPARKSGRSQAAQNPGRAKPARKSGRSEPAQNSRRAESAQNRGRAGPARKAAAEQSDSDPPPGPPVQPGRPGQPTAKSGSGSRPRRSRPAKSP